MSFVGTTVDAALGNINVSQGVLGFQTNTNSMGDPTKTVTVASGAALEFFNTTSVMTKLTTLNGGTIWGESGTGTQNTFAGAITVNSAGGTFDAGSALTGGTPNASAVLNLTGAIGGAGHVNKNGPGTVVISSLTNAWSGGTSLNTGTLVDNGNVPGSVTVGAGGTLGGSGSVAGTVNVVSGGFIAPGNSLGKLTVGSLTMSAGSQLSIQLGGTTPGTLYDTLNVTGAASLNGTLAVSFSNSFVPSSGSTAFDILNWGSLSGAFSSITLPALTAPMGWDLSQLYKSGVITATSFIPGDFNRDGHVTAADLAPMLFALTDAADYELNNSLSAAQLMQLGDINGDGLVNNADIQALLNNLIAGVGSTSPVPEPNAAVLLLLAAAVLLLCRCRQTVLMRDGTRN